MQKIIPKCTLMSLLYVSVVKYRSRTEIVSGMLEAANGGSTKTKIMYKAFLSYAQLKEYLVLLLENGLIEHDKQKDQYKTTEKGLRFLNLYSHIEDYAKPAASLLSK